jgi:hypothetical protein
MLSRKILVWAIILLSPLFVLSCSQEKKQKKAAVKSTKVQYTALQAKIKKLGENKLTQDEIMFIDTYLLGDINEEVGDSLMLAYIDTNEALAQLIADKSNAHYVSSGQKAQFDTNNKKFSKEIAAYDERHKAFEAELEANAAKITKDAQFNKYYEQFEVISNKMIKQNRLPSKEEAKTVLICYYYFKLAGVKFTKTLKTDIKNNEKVAEITFKQVTAEIEASYGQQ